MASPLSKQSSLSLFYRLLSWISVCLTVSLFVTACAAPTHVRPDLLETAKNPLVCANKTQCDQYWERAKGWLIENSHFPIHTQTESIITTTKPVEISPYLVFKITRDDHVDGSGAIKISADCGSDLGCIPDKWEAIIDLRAFLLEQ